MVQEIIHICNEQKIIFIKKILHITQQMLLACDSDKMEAFENLLQERYECMQRIEKCDALMKKPFGELSAENAESNFSNDDFCELQSEFQSLLRMVLWLNGQIEQHLQDKRKELIDAGIHNNTHKVLLHK